MEPGGLVDVDVDEAEESVVSATFDTGHEEGFSASAIGFFFSVGEGRGDEDDDEADDEEGFEEVGDGVLFAVVGDFALGFGGSGLLLTIVSSICLANCFLAFFFAFFTC